jgi:glucosamine--fructose-6-phosphate aminotransferase (isomerizing)
LQDGGGRGLAITNDPASALAKTAEDAVDLEMGEERAVPATKTVAGQLATFAIIASALGRAPFTRRELGAVPQWVQLVLDDPEPVADAADSLVGTSQLIIVARGFLYAAALETALKIKETCSLFADGYSAADLRHGPIAAVTHGLPVVAFAAAGPALADVASIVAELRARQANVLLIGSAERAEVTWSSEAPESLAPFLAVVRGQQLAHGWRYGSATTPTARRVWPRSLTSILGRGGRGSVRGRAGADLPLFWWFWRSSPSLTSTELSERLRRSGRVVSDRALTAKNRRGAETH